MVNVNTSYNSVAPAVILVHGSGVNGLGLVRSLGRQQIPVYVVYVRGHKNLAIISRYCHDTCVVDSLSGEIITQSLCKLAQKFNTKPVLFFDNDLMIQKLSPYANKIENHFQITSTFGDIGATTNKIFQMNAAKEAGLDVPRTWLPKTWDELEELDSKTVNSVIAKPSPAFFPAQSLPFKVIKAKNVFELRKFLERKVNIPDGIIIQEFIEGGDENVFVATCYNSENNNLTIAFTAKKLLQNPAGAGVMAIGQVSISEVVREASYKLISHINYYGIVSTEFKYSPTDGKYYFIELNPRTAQFHTIGRKANFELAYIAYLDHTNPVRLVELNPKYESKHKWIYTQLVVNTLLESKTKTKTKAKDIIELCRGKKEWAVYTADDIKPWFTDTLSYTILLTNRLLNKFKHKLFGL